MQSIEDKIYASIRLKGRGGAFTNKDYMSMGNRGSVDMALTSLLKAGKIRRVGKGLYDYPRTNKELGGAMNPDINKVVYALARKLGLKVQPDGAWAANMLGLSNQVPAKIIYLTDGRSKNIRIGGTDVRLKKVSPGKLCPGSEKSVHITCALRYLGRDGVDSEVIGRLREILPEKDIRRLVKDASYQETWIADAAKKLRKEIPR